MKQQLMGMLVVGLSFGSVAEAKSDLASVSVGSSCLNLRTSASSGSGVRSCLGSGTQVKVLGTAKRGKYTKVRVGNRTGYVWSKFLRSIAGGPPSVETAPQPEISSVRESARPELSAATRSEMNRSTRPLNVAAAPPSLDRSGLDISDQLPFERFSPSLPRDFGGAGFREALRQDLTSPDHPINAGPGTAAPTKPLADGTALNDISWAATESLEREVIGKNTGYTLSRPVGWAKISADGSVWMGDNKKTHCTAATHAHFLKTMGELHKAGLIKLNPDIIATLNSPLFRDTWNSNGYANGKIIQLLGGQNFSDVRTAKKGDFMKMDRSNGTGHTVIFSHLQGDKVCFWSGNKRNQDRTSGLGINCESIKGKTFTISRINNLEGLQGGLERLGHTLRNSHVFHSVRMKGGHGWVPRTVLALASPDEVRDYPAFNASDRRYASISGGRN